MLKMLIYPVLTKMWKRGLKFLLDYTRMYQCGQNTSFHFSTGAAHGIYGKNLYSTVLYPDQEVRYGKAKQSRYRPRVAHRVPGS
jgi:hypothetical protein